MNIVTGSIEIQMLLWSVILGLVQLMLATTMATRELGTKWNASPRDNPTPPVSVVTGRMLRAFANFKETFVFFAVAVLVVAVLGRHSATSALGAQLYLGATCLCAALCGGHSGAAHAGLAGVAGGHGDGAYRRAVTKTAPPFAGGAVIHFRHNYRR